MKSSGNNGAAVEHSNAKKANTRLGAEEVVSRVDFSKLRYGHKLKAIKFGRRGTCHEIKIHLSKDLRFIKWESKALGPKFGQRNKGFQALLIRILWG